jgi:hypothetical protein
MVREQSREQNVESPGPFDLGLSAAFDSEREGVGRWHVDRCQLVELTLVKHGDHRLMTEASKHHNSAICTVASTLLTRLVACWRQGECYIIRDADGPTSPTAPHRRRPFARR